MCPFLADLFHLAAFQSLYILLKLNDIQLYVYTTFCSSIYLLMDIWIISLFWLFFDFLLLICWVYT